LGVPPVEGHWLQNLDLTAQSHEPQQSGVQMAEHGEWNKKGATLSDATALKDYGVATDFIVQGIRAGKLEYREGAIWGNPYIKVLRSQLERFIAEELGSNYLTKRTSQTELRKVNKEIAELKKKLKDLLTRKDELEKSGAL
jgi:hypothetical protein